MNMPQPTDGHRKLQKLAGRWRGEERIHPSPWDPAGGTAMGFVENRIALSDFAVIQDYRQERNGATSFTGHGVFTFNAIGNLYTMHWWDNMGVAGPHAYQGGFDGDVLTLTCMTPAGPSRAVFDLREPGHYGFRLDISPDGQNWRPFMEGRYQKE